MRGAVLPVVPTGSDHAGSGAAAARAAVQADPSAANRQALVAARAAVADAKVTRATAAEDNRVAKAARVGCMAGPYVSEAAAQNRAGATWYFDVSGAHLTADQLYTAIGWTQSDRSDLRAAGSATADEAGTATISGAGLLNCSGRWGQTLDVHIALSQDGATPITSNDVVVQVVCPM